MKRRVYAPGASIALRQVRTLNIPQKLRKVDRPDVGDGYKLPLALGYTPQRNFPKAAACATCAAFDKLLPSPMMKGYWWPL